MEKKVLALDFGGTYLKYVLVDDHMNFYHQGKKESPRESEEAFVATVKEIYTKYQDEIKGIGISFGGKIDSKTGIVMSSGQFPFFNQRSVTDILRKVIPVKITIENDGICAALAEVKKGCLQGVSNALVVVLGTGIGGAAVLDGKIYKGTNFCSMELSLLRTYPDTELKRSWAFYGGGTTGLLRMAKEEMELESAIDGYEFFKLIADDNEDAHRVLDKYCDISATHLYNLQAIFDVEHIAIGGGISSQSILIEKIREKLQAYYDREEKYCLPPVMPKVTSCQYHNDSNIIGAWLTNILEDY